MASMEQLIALYRHEYAYYRAIAYNVLANRQDAEDVMQRVMIRLLERPEILQKVERPKPFLSRCVRNEAIGNMKWQGNRTHLGLLGAEKGDLAGGHPFFQG